MQRHINKIFILSLFVLVGVLAAFGQRAFYDGTTPVALTTDLTNHVTGASNGIALLLDNKVDENNGVATNLNTFGSTNNGAANFSGPNTNYGQERIRGGLTVDTFFFANETSTFTSQSATNVPIKLSSAANPTTNQFEGATSGGTISYYVRSNWTLHLPLGLVSDVSLGNTGSINSGLYFPTINNAAIAASGADVARFSSGVIDVGANQISFGNSVGSRDATIIRDASGVMAQRQGTTKQTNSVYGTFTSATDGEKLEYGYRGDLAWFFINSQTNGAGTLRPLAIGVTTNASITVNPFREATIGSPGLTTNVPLTVAFDGVLATNTLALKEGTSIIGGFDSNAVAFLQISNATTPYPANYTVAIQSRGRGTASTNVTTSTNSLIGPISYGSMTLPSNFWAVAEQRGLELEASGLYWTGATPGNCRFLVSLGAPFVNLAHGTITPPVSATAQRWEAYINMDCWTNSSTVGAINTSGRIIFWNGITNSTCFLTQNLNIALNTITNALVGFSSTNGAATDSFQGEHLLLRLK